jgi:hypothetical protein
LNAEVFGREKSLYSIFRKMKDKHLSFSQVLDIYGFRVVVDNVPTCYLALGALHSLFKPVPGKFKDYIAIPKANGYQSLHTTLIGPYGTPVEVQIRTREMHNVAQEGVAAHWLYKDSEESGADLQIKTHKWLQSLLEMQTSDSSEFFENVKIDLFPDEVYVFTPKGKIMAMPRGATVVDFAYAVHTDVGHHCSAARINHELSPLRTELRNGDLVEIVTSPQASPNPVWLTYVKTGRARSKIRHFLRTMQNEESARLGERLLRQELLSLGVVPISIPARGLGCPGQVRRTEIDRRALHRDRPRQAPALGGRPPPAGPRGHVAGFAEQHDPGHPRYRRHGHSAGALLPADPRRSDHRLDQERAAAWSSTPMTARPSASRGRPSRRSGSTSSGSRKKASCSISASRLRSRTPVACWRRWRRQLPKPARISSMCRWMPTQNACSRCSALPSRSPTAITWRPSCVACAIFRK